MMVSVRVHLSVFCLTREPTVGAGAEGRDCSALQKL